MPAVRKTVGMPHPSTPWREVGVAGVRVIVSTTEPVAVVRRPGAADIVASWPDLDIGLRTASAMVLPVPSGVWVAYRPETDDGPPLAPGRSAAVHIGLDGTTNAIDAAGWDPVGATRHGIWFTPPAIFPDPEIRAEWERTTVLRVIDAQGTTTTVDVDVRPMWALELGDDAYLSVYSSAPEAIGSPSGGATYHHRYGHIALPDGPLPRRLSVVDAALLDEGALMAALRSATPRDVPAPDGIETLCWAPVDLPEADRTAAVSAVVAEFADLDAYWHGDDGSVRPLSYGLADARVDVEGAWPDTRIVVSFRHPHYPDGRLRRTLRVFDDAGRIAPAPYAAIHVMEDLDTGHLPPLSEAHDGVLDF